MARLEQYEVWIQSNSQWEMIASFADFEVASSLTRTRSSRMRLIHTIYDEGKLIFQDLLAEVGLTRESG